MWGCAVSTPMRHSSPIPHHTLARRLCMDPGLPSPPSHHSACILSCLIVASLRQFWARKVGRIEIFGKNKTLYWDPLSHSIACCRCVRVRWARVVVARGTRPTGSSSCLWPAPPMQAGRGLGWCSSNPDGSLVAIAKGAVVVIIRLCCCFTGTLPAFFFQ